MLTIITTIKPEHLGNIRSGKKLFEMRKSCPKDAPFRVLCCQSGSGGKILAEFVCDSPMQVSLYDGWPELISGACVSVQQAEDYAKGKPVWFWDINNMIDYCSTKGYRVRNVAEFGLKRAPQSWCYVEEEQYGSLE